jgi:hypothetical protein
MMRSTLPLVPAVIDATAPLTVLAAGESRMVGALLRHSRLARWEP